MKRNKKRRQQHQQQAGLQGLVTRGPITQSDLRRDDTLCAQLASLKLRCFGEAHRGKYTQLEQLIVGVDDGESGDAFYGQVYFCVEDPAKISRHRMVAFAGVDAYSVVNDVGTSSNYRRRGLAAHVVSLCEQYCFDRGDVHVFTDILLKDEYWWPRWWKERGYTEIDKSAHANPTWESYDDSGAAKDESTTEMYFRLDSPAADNVDAHTRT